MHGETEGVEVGKRDQKKKRSAFAAYLERARGSRGERGRGETPPQPSPVGGGSELASVTAVPVGRENDGLVGFGPVNRLDKPWQEL